MSPTFTKLPATPDHTRILVSGSFRSEYGTTVSNYKNTSLDPARPSKLIGIQGIIVQWYICATELVSQLCSMFLFFCLFVVLLNTCFRPLSSLLGEDYSSRRFCWLLCTRQIHKCALSTELHDHRVPFCVRSHYLGCVRVNIKIYTFVLPRSGRPLQVRACFPKTQNGISQPQASFAVFL